MSSFKAYFKKEVIEAIRTHKYLIIALGFIFWALIDPLMLKLLPLFLKTTIPQEMLSQLTSITRAAAFQNMLKNTFQVSTLFVVFSLMGVLSAEVSSKKLVFPYSRGVRPAGMVMAKFIHYIITISVFILTAFILNYLYIKILFTEGILALSSVLQSSLLYMLYYIFVLAILLFLSSIFRKSILTGITTLVIIYTLNIFNQFALIRPYFPNYLLFKSADAAVLDKALIPAIAITICLVAIMIYFSILRMKRIDVS
jgi:ABC-2 type transport system permease protein